MIAAAAYIRRETAASIAINTVLSLVFFLIVFGGGGPVRIWGVGGYAFDFAPQGFMIALMATLVPGLLAAQALRRGTVAALAGRTILPSRLGLRALLLGVIGAGIGVAGASAILAVAGASELGWPTALIAKLVFGALLAAIVTPIGLRAALSPR